MDGDGRWLASRFDSEPNACVKGALIFPPDPGCGSSQTPRHLLPKLHPPGMATLAATEGAANPSRTRHASTKKRARSTQRLLPTVHHRNCGYPRSEGGRTKRKCAAASSLEIAVWLASCMGGWVAPAAMRWAPLAVCVDRKFGTSVPSRWSRRLLRRRLLWRCRSIRLLHKDSIDSIRWAADPWDWESIGKWECGRSRYLERKNAPEGLRTKKTLTTTRWILVRLPLSPLPESQSRVTVRRPCLRGK